MTRVSIEETKHKSSIEKVKIKLKRNKSKIKKKKQFNDENNIHYNTDVSVELSNKYLSCNLQFLNGTV